MINSHMLPKKVNKYNALSSVGYAVNGLKEALKSEPNILWQLLIGLVAVGISIIAEEYVFIPLHIVFVGLVVSTEIMNTSFEYLCDLVQPKYSEKVKSIKDIAAGAVLFSALSWLVVILVEMVVIVL